jgi:hypothetical protein
MRGSEGPRVGETGVYKWLQVENMHGKAHLSMDVATESKVADTKGSTATPYGFCVLSTKVNAKE